MDPSSNASPRRAAAQQLKGLRTAGVTGIVRTAKKELTEPVAVPAACPASPASLFAAQRSVVPLGEREERLRALAARVAACTRCEELARTRTQTVFGVGNPM